jgi:hypothetical protein
MTKEAGQSKALNSIPHQVVQDFADAMINLDMSDSPKSKIAYPWNPAESEDFFNELEQTCAPEFAEVDFAAKSQGFYAHLDRLFSATTLQTALSHKFALVPQALLNAIAQQAQQVAESSATLADQLVQSVQSVLPNWAEDDLYVLARPLAYAMRGEEYEAAVDTTLNNLRPVSWEQLSETEQARLTLAIARYALSQIGEN